MTRPRIALHITNADDIGFVVQEDGHIVAALASRQEVAEWIERRLGTPETIEQEKQAIAEAQEQFPNVISARTGPRAGWFRRS